MTGMIMLPDVPPSKPTDDADADATTNTPEDSDDTVAPVASPLFLYVLTCCSTIGGFLFGYDTGVISGALVLLKSPQVFGLTDLQSESVVSAAVFGAIVGAALSSCGTHVLGRKPVILASSLLFTFGSVLMGVAESFPALLVGRLVVGVGIGFSSMTVPLYIAEVSPPQIRGRLVSLNTVLVTGGQFFASVLAAALSKVDDGWRYMLGLAAIPAMVQVLGFLVLPESPRFLISRGKREAAWKALVQIRGTESIEAEYNAIESEIQKRQHAHEDDDESHRLSLRDELRKPNVVRALLLGCGLQALQQLCGINTVMYYGATIIQMAGFNDPSTAIWLSAVVSFSNFLFTFVGLYLVDHAGRRVLTLASLAGVVVSLVALGTSFYAAHYNSTHVVGAGVCSAISTCFDCVANAQCGFCETRQHPAVSGLPSSTGLSKCVPGDAFAAAASACPTTTSTSRWFYASCPDDNPVAGYLILVTLFVYLACFASGMGSTPWTINAEIYPLKVRSFALSAATSVNWVANLLVSFTFLSIINAFSASGAFWLYAAIASVGFVFLYFELPETKGLALEEIQQMFERRGNYANLDRK
jgi:MFS transporter, SP family, solute carrier family 2 (myo-inositol transporter), member 13